MNKDEIIDKLTSQEIRDYGVYNELLTKNWAEASEENLPMKIVAGLNNSDTTGILLEILKTNPEKVFEGMKIAAYVNNAEEMILYLPEYAEDVEEIIEKSKAYGVKVETGIINLRDLKGCIINHIVAMADVADCITGNYVPGVYVSVNGEKLKRIKEDTKISEIIKDEEIKGLELGHNFHGPEAKVLTLKEAGITNGLVRTFTEKDCMVQISEKTLLAYRKQSCGRCVFCREGLLQIQTMIKEITEGKGKQEYFDFIEEIGEAMTYSTLCSLGQKSSEMALSGLKNFKEQYNNHMKKKQCSAGVCFSSVAFYINPKTCEGCGECMDVCPANCIEGKSGYIHMIDTLDCKLCGKCIEACVSGSIMKTEGKSPKLPNKLTKCGRFKK